jgi:hypothetical protein
MEIVENYKAWSKAENSIINLQIPMAVTIYCPVAVGLVAGILVQALHINNYRKSPFC